MPLHKSIVGHELNNLCMIPLAWEKVQTKCEPRHGATFTQLFNRLRLFLLGKNMVQHDQQKQNYKQGITVIARFKDLEYEVKLAGIFKTKTHSFF